jgi:phosphoribosylformylglycinamidine synthase
MLLASVGREDDVKFQALCEARAVPCLRIGVTDATSGLVEIKDIADLKLDDVRQAWSGGMSGLFD